MTTRARTIHIVGAAETAVDAHDQAALFVDRLVETGEFDDYDDALEVDGPSGRTVHLVAATGKAAVEAALTRQRAVFMQQIGIIRRMLTDYTDEQIYQNDYGSDRHGYTPSRIPFIVVGEGASICELYGDDEMWGDRICNEHDYRLAIEGHEPDNLWLTTFQVYNERR